MDSLSSYSSSTSKRLKKISSGVENNENIPSSIIALLPDGIQILILNKLDVVGFHRFGAVCRQWQSIAIAANKIRHRFLLKPQFPWLILSFFWESDSEYQHHHGFHSLFHDRTFRLEMPKIRGARCCGSSWGWLIMLGNHDGCMFVFNPFTRIRIDLPPKSTLPYLGVDFVLTDFGPSPHYIRKVMLLSPPPTPANDSNLDENPSTMATGDCLVIAIYCSRHLAFCRLGDGAWTALTERFIEPQDFGYEDLIVYQGKLYTIKFNYDLILLEFSPEPRETSCDIAPPTLPELEEEYFQSSLYLVECCGQLLVVARWSKFSKEEDLTLPYDFDDDRHVTYMFKVYKLDLEHRCWIEVEDLGDQMLFVGTSTGVSISALDYPGLKGNSIYFTDEYFHHYLAMWPPPQRERTACHDLGVFHLQDNSIVPFLSNASHSYLSAPVWFTPVSW